MLNNKRRETTVFVSALIILVFPALGFPPSWESFVIALGALVILFILFPQMIELYRKHKEYGQSQENKVSDVHIARKENDRFI